MRKKFYVSVTAQLTETYTIEAEELDDAVRTAERLMLEQYKVQRVFIDGSAPIATGFDAVDSYVEEE